MTVSKQEEKEVEVGLVQTVNWKKQIPQVQLFRYGSLLVP